MKWAVLSDRFVKGEPFTKDELVEADSAFTSPSGCLIFNRMLPTPIEPDAKPTKRKSKPKTQLVRAFNSGSWSDVRLEP